MNQPEFSRMGIFFALICVDSLPIVENGKARGFIDREVCDEHCLNSFKDLS